MCRFLARSKQVHPYRCSAQRTRTRPAFPIPGGWRLSLKSHRDLASENGGVFQWLMHDALAALSR
jgi:hypothetical protein